jgi:hypothetical protein
MTKIKNIKIGDIVEDELVTKIDLEGKQRIWSGKPNWTFIELRDPHYGQMSKEINPDEKVKIETNPKKIIKLCRDALGEIYSHIDRLESDATILHMKIKEAKKEAHGKD